jgi:RNA polymerase sigma factor for flagellar operon FliA
MQPALKIEIARRDASCAPRHTSAEEPSSARPARIHNLTHARHRKILNEYTPLVERAVRQAMSRMGFRCAADELRSAAWTGLLDAISRFDAKRGIPFEAFASHRVNGAILDEVRVWDSLTRPTRRRARDVERIRLRLTRKLNRDPSEEELAQAVGEDLETFHKRSARERSQTVVHMEDLGREGAPAELTCEELSPLDAVCDEEQRENLSAAVALLPERLQRIITLYYQEELSYREIGERLGVTESRVCQLLKGAHAQLREQLDPAASHGEPLMDRRSCPPETTCVESPSTFLIGP